VTSPDFAQPFVSENERNGETAALEALSSHLANLESMAALPPSTWSDEDIAALPPVAGEEGESPPERLARWASDHAEDLSLVRQLAASPALTDADLRRGLSLAEGAFAALLGISPEEIAVRIHSDQGRGLRTLTSAALPSAALPSAASPPSDPSPADRQSGTTRIIVQPRPDERLQRVRDKGPDKGWIERRIDPSDSWWEKGALVVDDQGSALVDADGARHPFPAAAQGGYLVRATVTVMTGGGGHPVPDLLFFLAAPTDQGKRVLLRLPSQGFGEGEVGEGELEAFALAAGLTYVERDLTYAKVTEFPGIRDAPSLEWAIHDQAARDRSLQSRLHHAGDRIRHPFENPDGG
jgi:hypothetical protein